IVCRCVRRYRSFDFPAALGDKREIGQQCKSQDPPCIQGDFTAGGMPHLAKREMLVCGARSRERSTHTRARKCDWRRGGREVVIGEGCVRGWRTGYCLRDVARNYSEGRCEHDLPKNCLSDKFIYGLTTTVETIRDR
ncbi:unnamed protein product, partial [Ectocarpus sp. 6 AP-2014]